MNLAAYPVQILTPQLVDLGISNIDAMNKGSGLSTPATKTLRPMYGAHCRVPNHIFGETKMAVVSSEKYDYDYKYETDFKIWK